MESIPRPFSPQYVPQPLCPSLFHKRSFAPERTATPAVIPDRSGSPQYLSTVFQPNEDPYTIIHAYYNVSPVSFSLGPDGSIPRTIEPPFTRASDPFPTHVIVVLDSTWQSPSAKAILARRLGMLTTAHPLTQALPPHAPHPFDPYLIPIDAESFFLSFSHDTARALGSAALSSKWSRGTSPQICTDRATGARTIALPVIPLYVPHPPSLAHILLFAQAIPLPEAASTPTRDTVPCPHSPPPPQSSASALVTYLPLAAIEEFPSAPAMAAVMARVCTSEALTARAAFNDGAWRNVLELAPADAAVVDLVRAARNVAADAVHLQRQRERENTARLPPTPPPTTPRDPPVVKSPATTVATSAKTARCDTARDERDRDRKRLKPSVQVAQIPLPATAVRTTGLPPSPRLPVVEVDYPIEFVTKTVAPDVPRAITASEPVEKRCAVQCLAQPVSVSHLDRRSSRWVGLEGIQG